MSKYTFTFSGEITIEAATEDKAYEIAEELIATTPYQSRSADISVDEITLIDEE